MLEAFLALFAATLLMPAGILLVEVIAALPTGTSPHPVRGQRESVAILVPAHDEALMIAETLGAIGHQLEDGDRLLVVADNCTDDTARIAAACGAEVIERHDPARRGKGYALDFSVRHLERDPRAVVIVIDADCRVAEGAIERLVRACTASGRPVQALDLMRLPVGAAAPGSRLAEFAWIVKNHVRALGATRLGVPCPLMGTGMAFPWDLIRSAALASGEIVEDLALGIQLARKGTPAVFCPEALVTSEFPHGAEALARQRTRWEHGYLGVMLKQAPRLLAEGITRCRPSLLGAALDLAVPPVALLAMLSAGLLGASATFFVVTGRMLPLSLATASSMMVVLAVLLAWARFARTIPLTALAYAPVYALGKIPLYMRFFARRQVQWVRSERGGRQFRR